MDKTMTASEPPIVTTAKAVREMYAHVAMLLEAEASQPHHSRETGQPYTAAAKAIRDALNPPGDTPAAKGVEAEGPQWRSWGGEFLGRHGAFDLYLEGGTPFVCWGNRDGKAAMPPSASIKEAKAEARRRAEARGLVKAKGDGEGTTGKAGTR